ncbi:hypothetical protein HYR99_34295 [Candidatus Poribacteria bacterium]|nr:hypothetical protein [Candidatus Poribacteria bacterium]
MDPKFYIISTKLPECRKKFYETGETGLFEFNSLYTRQPDSQFVIESGAGDYSNFQFVFFDRVRRKIDNRPNESYRCLTGLYRLREVRCNPKISQKTGRKEHSLFLELIRQFKSPIPFGPGTDLWERLSRTQGKKLSHFYNARRILLPLTEKKDVSIINACQ